MSVMWFVLLVFYLFFFKQRTADEMRISDWSSDVCSSDLPPGEPADDQPGRPIRPAAVIAPVAAAIDAVGARQPARLIITPVAIIAVGIIIAVAGLVAVPVVTAIAPPVAHVQIGRAHV